MSAGPEPLQITHDNDWVRGNALQLGRAIADASTDSDAGWRRLYLGDAALRLMRGVAHANDISAVMGHLIATCELRVQECSKQLLELADISSEKAKQLHFDARVAAAVIGHVNQLVRDGQAAASEIQTTQQEESNGY